MAESSQVKSARRVDLSFNSVIQEPSLIELERPIPIRRLYGHINQRDLDLEFHLLKRITETRAHFERLASQNEMVINQNRYSDVIPFTATQVRLQNNAYINANSVDGELSGLEEFQIATQGPMKSSRDRFWQMVCEQNIKLIIMIGEFKEQAVSMCSKYFPLEGEVVYGDYHIELVSYQEKFERVHKRVLKITNQEDQEEYIVTHIQLAYWNDNKVPELPGNFNSISYILYKIKKVAQQQRGAKVAVHCSAGIGRTGTVLSLFNIISVIENQLSRLNGNGAEAEISIFGVVRRLREQRWSMVKNADQYKFLYNYVSYWVSAYHENSLEALNGNDSHSSN